MATSQLNTNFNKGSKILVSNYRQISLLCIVSKLCECCILRKILPGVIHLLSSVQHGFVRGKSCVTQLLTFLHDLGASLDAGDEIDVIYLDFSKAFDSVPHGKLFVGACNIRRSPGQHIGTFPFPFVRKRPARRPQHNNCHRPIC